MQILPYQDDLTLNQWELRLEYSLSAGGSLLRSDADNHLDALADLWRKIILSEATLSGQRSTCRRAVVDLIHVGWHETELSCVYQLCADVGGYLHRTCEHNV